MNVTEQLKEVVDAVARSGALTPDAIRQFDDLRKKAESLELSLEMARRERDASKEAGNVLKSQLQNTTQLLETTQKRAEEAERKVKDSERAVLRAEYDREARQEMRSILSDVFRNFEVNRTITRSAPRMSETTYPGQVPYKLGEQEGETTRETEVRK